MKNSYSIIDLSGYAETVRTGAASEYADNISNNLDEFITIRQIETLIRQKSIGYDENDNFLINEDIHNEIYDEICVWIFNAGLSKLAASNKLECAWCDDDNEMVFWAPSINNEANPNEKTTDNRN